MPKQTNLIVRPPAFLYREAKKVFELHCEQVPLAAIAARYGPPASINRAQSRPTLETEDVSAGGLTGEPRRWSGNASLYLHRVTRAQVWRAHSRSFAPLCGGRRAALA